MNKMFSESEYKIFFEWILEKKVKMNKEVDITMVSTYDDPCIYYPDEIKRIFETEAMKRTGKVTQLGTGIVSNPMLFHTRLEHQKGAGNNILNFYMYQFKNIKWREKIEKENKKIEVLADIVQMYTHDIGHNVLSHALEILIKNNIDNNEFGAAHEILGRRILNEDQEMVEVLNSIHPELLNKLNMVSNSEYDLIALKEGDIDCDRLDYLTRDTLFMGDNEPKHLTDNIIKNCEIADVRSNNKDYQLLLYDYDALENIECFLESRAENYKNEYFSNTRASLDALSVFFCETLAYSDYECDLKKYICHCIESGAGGIDIQEYKKWDDIRYYNELIDIAKNCDEEYLRELAIACLPSIEGLVNLSYELLDWNDENIDSLKLYEKNFYFNVKRLVKQESELQKRLLVKEKLIFLDSESEEDILIVLNKLENKEIEKEKLSKLISWNKKIKKYGENMPLYIKGHNGEIYLCDELLRKEMPKFKTQNCGILALPIQMKMIGFSDEEIKEIQDEFINYNKEHSKNEKEKNNKIVYEKLDMRDKIVLDER